MESGRTVLAVDLGRRRIGVAVSDASGTVALPVGALESRGLERDVAAVHELARERGAKAVVVGLPIHMDGRKGPEARAAQRFASRLAEVSGLPVETLDERWTSVAAERALEEVGTRARDRRGRVDAIAATLLLRTFLERRSGSVAAP